MSLKTLSGITLTLFIISLLVFLNEHQRGTDLLSGSDYIKGLDVNRIQKIKLKFQGNKKIILVKDSNKFLLENKSSYPVKTESINDLIYKIASIQVIEKVTDDVDEEDLKMYGLDKKNSKYLVELYDSEGKKSISFRVGNKSKGKSKGNYLYKDGQDSVYLSTSSLFISSSYKEFVDTVLLDIKRDNIANIDINSDKRIKIVRAEKEFVIKAPKDIKFKKERAKEYAGQFGLINFKEFFTINDSKVRTLEFKNEIKIQLKNKLIYNIKLASKDKNYFVKLSALVNEVPRQIVIDKNDNKEKLQNIESMIKAQGEAQRFNLEKANWIYKVDKTVFDKLSKKAKFFF